MQSTTNPATTAESALAARHRDRSPTDVVPPAARNFDAFVNRVDLPRRLRLESLPAMKQFFIPTYRHTRTLDAFAYVSATRASRTSTALSAMRI